MIWGLMDQPKKEVVHSSFEQITTAFHFSCIIFQLHVKVNQAMFHLTAIFIII